MDDKSLIRINKYLSDIGICSRREADRLIEANRIKINDELAQKGSKINPHDKITIDDKIIHATKKTAIYLAFNKPRGIVCTTDTRREKNNIIDFINYPQRIYPIGRLDKDSQGLILLTNDGSIVNKILKASNYHEKEYIVEVDRSITPYFLRQMQQGVPILDTVTRPCEVTKISWNTFKIVLTQGLNRQIRRMCEQLGYKVKTLERVRIMNIHLNSLAIGTYRNLTDDELSELTNSSADSSVF